MDIFRQNRLIAAILGGLVVMALLVVLFNDDPSSPNIPASDLPTRTPNADGTAAPEAVAFPRPNIEQLACEPLLDFDDVDPVLGSTQWLTISRGETCTHQLLDDSTVFVRIQPGHPNDLIDGGILGGEPGQTVPGVGDAAAWFAEASTLSVAAEGRFGVLVFRITLSNTELDAPARLEAAKTLALAALPRFPDIDAPPPPPADPIVIRTEHGPVDQASQSYVTNLRAREAAGEWTRGEGIIATLRLFAGETSVALVTPARTLSDQSGSEIVQLALGYLANEATAQEQTEIQRLLAALLPTTELLQAMSGATAARPLTGPRPIALTAQEGTEGCQTYWGTDDPCITEAVSPQLDEMFGPGKYSILAPAEGVSNTRGWTDAHLFAAIEALERSAINFEARGTMPESLEIVFTPLGVNRSVALGDTEACLIILNTPMQALFAQDPEMYKQWIASEIARCFARSNFPAASLDTTRWWETGYIWYLSDVIYADASVEKTLLGMPEALAPEELSLPIPDRVLTNIAFFESLDAQIGAAAVDNVVRAIPAGLETYGGIGKLTHEFVKVLSDGLILDQGGAHDYSPDADETELREGLIVLAEPQPFGVERYHLTVPSGMYACVEYDRTGDVLDSLRPGGPGDGGAWASPPSTLNGDSTLVATATKSGASLAVTVKELSEEDDCEEEKPEPDPASDPPPPCGFCEGTSFWYDSVEDWLRAIAGGG